MDLSVLNDKQRQAVSQIDGPLLVLAGAGSGKTRVLTYRIAHLIQDHGVMPSQILALTFTNKAAKEMRERVERLIGQAAGRMWIGTFHAVCVRLLRRDAELIGYTKNFNIYDTTDQRTLIKNVMKELRISDKTISISHAKSVISDAKNNMVSVARFQDINQHDLIGKQIGQIYQCYQRDLAKNNAMDFDDLIVNTLKLFQTAPDVLTYYQNKFKYIHVDEYQDTNSVQYTLIKKLSLLHDNICVVGDNDQSIYGWRGADIRNIQDFDRDFQLAKVIMLEQNYRSSQKILQAANAVIKHNGGRRDKKLWTDNHAGDDVQYYRSNDGSDEARFVANQIIKGVDEGANYSDYAILYRTNAQSRTFEDAFNRAGIPHKILGGHKFYDRLEIKDLMAYLKVIVNPADDISLLRIINVPKRSIGAKTVERITTIATNQALSLYEAIDYCIDNQALSARSLTTLTSFYKMLSGWIQTLPNQRGSEILADIIEQTGYLKQLKLEQTIEAQGRIENIDELLAQISYYEQSSENPDLSQFLQEISLLSDQDDIEDDQRGQVLLMTIHAAKGLEFNTVFLVGMEEMLFPSAMSLESDTGVDEERRLCYVGITRAQKKLYITHAYMRNRFGKTMVNPVSRFVEELPTNIVFSHNGDIATRQTRAINFSNQYKVQATHSSIASEASLNLAVGTRVRHQQFGEGLVVAVKERGIVTIAFVKKGVKHLDSNIAPLEIISWYRRRYGSHHLLKISRTTQHL